MMAIRLVRDDWGSPHHPHPPGPDVFMRPGETVESPTDTGLFAWTMLPKRVTGLAANVLFFRRRGITPGHRMLLVEIDDDDDVIKNVGQIQARCLTVLHEFTDEELEQLAAGDLTPLD